MAFRATQALRMAVTKTSTGLVGLAVDPNGRVNYINMGKKILDRVKKIPPHAQYRKDVEAIFSYRLKVCEENEDEEKIEQTIALGQLEEMIEEGKDELKLIDMYYDAKMWEVVDKMNEGREDLALDDYTDPEDLIASGESAEASSSK